MLAWKLPVPLKSGNGVPLKPLLLSRPQTQWVDRFSYHLLKILYQHQVAAFFVELREQEGAAIR
jgi:hypothetical protein